MATIAITNVSGSLVGSYTASTPNGYLSKTITLGSELPGGIYFVKVVSGSKSSTIKIIKK